MAKLEKKQLQKEKEERKDNIIITTKLEGIQKEDKREVKKKVIEIC